jgi:hypothetical protein
MPKEGVAKSEEALNQFCLENGFVGWMFVSAKDNINVDESAKFLVTKVININCVQMSFIYFKIAKFVDLITLISFFRFSSVKMFWILKRQEIKISSV